MGDQNLPIRIFVGYDTSEIVAYHVFCQSVISHSSVPVCFVPLSLNLIQASFKRPRDPLQSTDFSFSRFLVPYLSGYHGWSLFMDGDMLMRCDIADLISLRDDSYAVMVCPHDYTPRFSKKFLRNDQTQYEKKNWSSVVLFNNSRCRKLTPEFINRAAGLELHQFQWLGSENEIGKLPLSWNWLVGEYPFDAHVKLAHFTLGGPYFQDSSDCDFSNEWRRELSLLLSSVNVHRS